MHWVTAVLHNGLGRYEEALAAAQQAGEDTYASWWRDWGLVELIEAAARSGKTELAADALGQLSQATAASGTDWALGIEARSRALLTEGEAAEPLYRQAIEALGRTRVRVELARAHLLYGEWLRRERRRLDAREQLRRAHKLFTEFGMEAFAERARVELEATGEHAAQTDRRDARRPDPPGSTDLPPRRRRCHQPRNRRPAVHQPQHRRLPPPQGVPQARSEVPPPTQTAPAPASRTPNPAARES